MTSPQPLLDVVWSPPEGREIAIGAADARIDVTQGVRINVAFGTTGPGGVAVDLALSGRRPLGDGSGEANARFVIIPLSESALLVAVAEPSAEAVNLMPVASTPVWAVVDGGSMPARITSLTATGPGGVSLILELIPGPPQMAVCALRVLSASSRVQAAGAEPGSPPLSLVRVSQETVRITVVPGVEAK